MSVTYRKPIVIEAGELEQIQSVDGLDVGMTIKERIQFGLPVSGRSTVPLCAERMVSGGVSWGRLDQSGDG